MIEPFKKPTGWEKLPLYKKIKIYGKNLTKEHAQYVDKLEAKQTVKHILGDNIEVARVVRILNNWDELQQDDLNPRHIIKSSHASGWNINITENTSYVQALYKLKSWNCHFTPYLEIQYTFLKPRFFIEEKINDPIFGFSGNILVYMFRYVNYGELLSIGVGHYENQYQKTNHYDTDWNLILEPELNFVVPKPNKLDDMLRMSRQLAENFEFVRIDFFYDNQDKIYFSEFTFTPKAGKPVFPMSLELEYGKKWN
jgi:TupA-like ATPgrasp